MSMSAGQIDIICNNCGKISGHDISDSGSRPYILWKDMGGRIDCPHCGKLSPGTIKPPYAVNAKSINIENNHSQGAGCMLALTVLLLPASLSITLIMLL